MTSSRGSEVLRPPRGGSPPRDSVALATGEAVFLAPIAAEAAQRHWADTPEDRERYGDAGLAWCAHDTQYILSWAFLGRSVLAAQLAWLARVLAARGYPLEHLRRVIKLAADVVEERHGDAAAEAVASLRAEAASLPV